MSARLGPQWLCLRLNVVRLFVACVLALSVSMSAQTRLVYVYAPRVVLAVGEEMQLLAGSRDPRGEALNDRFAWTASSPGVVSVSTAGVVTARSIGIANVTAAANSVNSAPVAIQVVPARVEVKAAREFAVPGGAVQFTAIAYDVADQPIDGVQFRWRAVAVNNSSTSSTIDASGVLSPMSAGWYTVYATIVYNGTSLLHLPAFEAWTHIEVRLPKDYHLTRIVSNEWLERDFRLEPSNSNAIAINDNGAVAIPAVLDGEAHAILLYEDGRWSTRAPAGIPSAAPGAFVFMFNSPLSLNNSGQLASSVWTPGGPEALAVSDPDSLSLIGQGFSEGAFESLDAFGLSKRSLNNRGSLLIAANFRLATTRQSHRGLFRFVRDGVQMIWSTVDPLPGFPYPFTFEGAFGHDDNGVTFFTVRSGSLRAIYRADGVNVPVRIASTGLLLGGDIIADVGELLISPKGTIAFSVRLSGGLTGMGRLRPADREVEFVPVRTGGLLGVNDSGKVLFQGEAGSARGWGVNTWDGQEFVRVIEWGARLDGGETYGYPANGFISASGEITVVFETPENPLVVIRGSSTFRTLFKSGARVSARLPRNIRTIIPGARSGPVRFVAGSGAGFFETTGSTTKKIWSSAGPNPPGLRAWGTNCFGVSPRGDLVISMWDGLMKWANGQLQTVIRYPFEFRERGAQVRITSSDCNWDNGPRLGLNDNGTMAWGVWAETHNRLLLQKNGSVDPILVLGSTSPTPSPSGGVFQSLRPFSYDRHSSVLVDDLDRVLVYAVVSGGPSGLFLYENGQWRTAALLNQTTIGGQRITQFQAVRVAGRKFYALLAIGAEFSIAEYDGQRWTEIVKVGDRGPDGRRMNNVSSSLFDVNRRGDIVFTSNDMMIVRLADGSMKHVVSPARPVESGEHVFFYQDVELRDDRSLYFTASDSMDRLGVYRADPRY